MSKENIKKAPPMGWNSWDCFGASVTEEELMANARYMKDNLKQFGWEYIVCDIQWYEPTADSTEYHNFADLEMDNYSRLVPAVNRFPSAINGKGFKPIADSIHEMGLKFGIHIMRGIPRQAVHANTPIKGTSVTARDIAMKFSICSWNTDMYGIDFNAYGAQTYYDSLFELYAEWGIDFVKVDDICNTYFKPHDLYSAKNEIELIRRAIDRCGRDIVLSISPGPASLEHLIHLSENANMWRITADFWDSWNDLYGMFEKCHQWSPYVGEGCWPDCDMLPLGHISIRGQEHGITDRWTRFTREEQRTMMTLWCIFRSPLMFGGHMPDNDEYTLSLITNSEVLHLLKASYGAHQLLRSGNQMDIIIWKSYDEDGSQYISVFNTNVCKKRIEITRETLKIASNNILIRDVWEQKNKGKLEKSLDITIPAHGCVLYKISEELKVNE